MFDQKFLSPKIQRTNYAVSVNFKYLQSAAKLFEHLRSYLQFFSDLIANFYHLMLVTNSIKTKDHNLRNIYFRLYFQIFIETALGMSFFDTNYLKCSNNFTADCNLSEVYVPNDCMLSSNFRDKSQICASFNEISF